MNFHWSCSWNGSRAMELIQYGVWYPGWASNGEGKGATILQRVHGTHSAHSSLRAMRFSMLNFRTLGIQWPMQSIKFSTKTFISTHLKNMHETCLFENFLENFEASSPFSTWNFFLIAKQQTKFQLISYRITGISLN